MKCPGTMERLTIVVATLFCVVYGKEYQVTRNYTSYPQHTTSQQTGRKCCGDNKTGKTDGVQGKNRKWSWICPFHPVILPCFFQYDPLSLRLGYLSPSLLLASSVWGTPRLKKVLLVTMTEITRWHQIIQLCEFVVQMCIYGSNVHSAWSGILDAREATPACPQVLKILSRCFH